MSELTVTLLRYGFLALLWVFIAAVVFSQARDLTVNGRARAAARAGSARAAEPPRQERRAPEPAPEPRTPAPTTGGTRHRPQQLVVVEGPLAGSSYQLGSAPVMLGRSPEATVPLEDDYASGRHARLFPQGSRWFLEDLGSTNGTFLRDQKLSRAAAVDPGMQFRVGRTVMELRP
ncbi:FHA domain-containing protein [Glutamicibacter protophormiae]|uniref:FHA domain-containing protein FhaB/FipA n=1 Tax=Kocuria sp. HSID17590 TaxID=2419513 RepID=UPI000F87815F|nr:FHA domain-containing protein [Kocuria sp. HSID17590]RUP84071.1 FHA domain-containing protein [Kocuria sp. HSID17590]WNB88160.1 FHA domain-containing protein [Glutamicibacter protophormiae]